MPTIIERRTTLGPQSAPRTPLPTPGPQPTHRVDVMSLQQSYGQPVTLAPNLGTRAAEVPSFNPASGSAPTLVEGPGGIPVLRFVEDSSLPAGQGNDALHSTVTGAPFRTILAVARFTALSSVAAQGAVIFKSRPDSYLGTLHAQAAGATAPGRLQGIGASGNAQAVGVDVTYGPNVPLQFLAITYQGAATRLQVDSLVGTGSTTDYTATNSNFTIGFQKGNNYVLELFAIEAHTTRLTPAQLEEKRAHYRALAQF